MSDYCQDALCCRPEDLTRAMPIHTRKITDSCRDKDCIEDLRVYMTRESQNILDTCGTAKVRSAELIHTAIDVAPVAFNRNHYCIDLTFYYRIIADATVNERRPACLCGLAMFSKRAVLCGENSGVHVFSSDGSSACGCSANLPTAVVEVMGTNSQSKIRPISISKPGCFPSKQPGFITIYSHSDSIPSHSRSNSRFASKSTTTTDIPSIMSR